MKFLLGFLCAFFTASLFAHASVSKLPDGYRSIWLARTASPAVAKAARDMAGLLERDFGQRPTVSRLPLVGEPFGLHVGAQPDHSAFDDDPLTDEILISRSPRGLEITGPDNSSTAFAVYAFCEKALGWLYLQPGPLGLEKQDNPPFLPPAAGPPATVLYDRAGFLSRNLRGISPGTLPSSSPDWSRWQRLRERFRYNHSLHRVAAPALFETHPEWFAKNPDGSPRKPFFPKPHGYNDHPDLTHPDLRQWVVDQSIASLAENTPLQLSADTRPLPTPPPGGSRPFLRQSPGALSLSLSLGDSYIFGHFPDSYRWNPDGWFRHWPDWSNHVFAYTNAVAEEIHQAYRQATWPFGEKPELFLGALSYLVWENVPDFPLHPRIVPYLTFDRSQWYDPAARTDDLRLVQRWANHSQLPPATWDYLFGYGFLIPRSLSAIVADSIPALHQRGLRGYFSQVAALWPYDGHTTYLTARLLWNPEADADAILKDYFNEFYGPAANAMRAFFDLAESRWMNQSGSGWWLRHWEDPYQIGLLAREDLQTLGTHLGEALAAAASVSAQETAGSQDPHRFRLRVEEAVALFQLTTALHRYQTAVFDLQQSVNRLLFARPAERPPFLAILQQAETALRLRAQLLATRDRVTADRPRLHYAKRLSWAFRYDNIGGAIATVLTRLANSPAASPEAAQRAASLLHQWTSDTQSQPLPFQDSGTFPEVLFDNSFARIEDERIWHHQVLDSENLRLSVPHNDHAGYRVANIQRGQFYQLFPIEENSAYMGRLDFRTRQSLSGQVQIRLDFLDENQQSLEADSLRARLLPNTPATKSQSIATVAAPPPDAAYGRIIVRFFMLDRDQPVHLEQVSVHRLPLRVSTVPESPETPPSSDPSRR